MLPPLNQKYVTLLTWEFHDLKPTAFEFLCKRVHWLIVFIHFFIPEWFIIFCCTLHDCALLSKLKKQYKSIHVNIAKIPYKVYISKLVLFYQRKPATFVIFFLEYALHYSSHDSLEYRTEDLQVFCCLQQLIIESLIVVGYESFLLTKWQKAILDI